jgi:hypothetical protein
MNKRLVYGGSFLIFLLAGSFAVIRRFAAPLHGLPADTPITVAGSSVYATSQYPWSGSDATYTTTGSSIGQLYTLGVSGVPNTLPLLTGWVIYIDTKNVNTGLNESVQICSTQDCNPATPISSQTVYFQISDKTLYRWAIYNNKELHFHDRACDGSSGDGEDRKCDFLVDVRIKGNTATGPAVYAGECTRLLYGKGHCAIGIGKNERP